jgi:TolA-binding protein/peroxiredoxin
MHKKPLIFACATLFIGFYPGTSTVAAPSVADALKLAPMQKNVDYDVPAAAEAGKCTIKAEKVGGTIAWVVRDPSGLMLRYFSDSNNDNVVDTWSYYKNGTVVYRDIDANYNGKADQFRWFNTAGSRWGLNHDEVDGIDTWKAISAEEVAEEVIAALGTQDSKRFTRLLLTTKDLEQLGLKKEEAGKLKSRLAQAPKSFQTMAKDFAADSKYADFGGLRPGTVPAGTRGLSADLLVYENVWAMVEQKEKHLQLQLGTMVRIGAAWKLIDGPTSAMSDQVARGFFFNGDQVTMPAASEQISMTSDGKMQEILSALEKLDQQLASATKAQMASLHAKRVEYLQQLAEAAADTTQRDQWLIQLADMIRASVQDGSYPGGIKKLEQIETELKQKKGTTDMVAYFQFQRMLAEYYGVTLAAPDVNYATAQAKWLKDLEKFVTAYPKSQHSGEAIYQLAMESDMSGDAKTATTWYSRLVKDFPNHAMAPKAKGAVTRLTSPGRPLSLKGTTLDGVAVDLGKLRGKSVAIQYWNTSSPTCSADHAVMKDLYAKYGGRGLEIIGVNLDYASEDLTEYLKTNRLPWKQLHEKGGFESRLANEMGVITLPLMLLVDSQGNVVSNNIPIAELEAAVKKQLAAQGKLASKRQRKQ